MTQKLKTVGIPLEKVYLTKNKPHSFFAKFIDDNGKKIKLFFFSLDVLGLGDLKERPGYKGYGNFIGTEYEVEYYKVSHVVKSMKIINQPHQYSKADSLIDTE